MIDRNFQICERYETKDKVKSQKHEARKGKDLLLRAFSSYQI